MSLNRHPTSSQISFLSNRTEDRDYNDINDIWLVSVEGNESRKLTVSQGPIHSFAWSPTGGHLAFVGNDRANQLGAHKGMWLLSPTTGEMRNLTAEFERSVGSIAIATSWKGPTQVPIWAPGGDALYFLASDAGNTHIFRVGLRGESHQVVGGERVCLSFALSPDGENIVFIASTSTQPPEVFVCSRDGSDERQLTRLNDQLLKEVELIPAEQFQYQSDDASIDGWVLKPIGFQARQKCPLILCIHGGPLAFYGNSFLFDQQLLAASGYVVLLSNPRGSAGYSEEFANCVRGDLGGKDYDDLIRAVDYVIDLGYVDSARMALTGGSYGGYLTNRIISLTDRFRAAVAENCISNFYSLYGTTDTTFLDCEWFFIGMPQDKPDLYMERSPITRIRDITTPLLIIHGEEDLICPIEQAEQLFIGLKRLNREVTFIRFLGENHNLSGSGRPQARIERLSRILDWFEQYLQPDTQTE